MCFFVALGSNFMLQRPMLSIVIIAICSWIHYWDTCTRDMLVTKHKEKLGKGKSNINKCKKEELNYALMLPTCIEI